MILDGKYNKQNFYARIVTLVIAALFNYQHVILVSDIVSTIVFGPKNWESTNASRFFNVIRKSARPKIIFYITFEKANYFR